MVIIGRSASKSKIPPLVGAFLFAFVTAVTFTVEFHTTNQSSNIGPAEIAKRILAPSVVVAAWIWGLNRIEGIMWFILMIGGATLAILIGTVLT